MNRIFDFLRRDTEYFIESATTIKAYNRRMLKDACILYGIVLLCYTAGVFFMQRSMVLLRMYIIFDVFHVLFCIAFFKRYFTAEMPAREIQMFCSVFEILLLGFFAVEGVFPFRYSHSIYIPIAILLVNLLFIHKSFYIISLTATYLTSFAVMSVLYKTPAAYSNDVYIAVATFIASIIGYALIAKLRHSESAARTQLEHVSMTDMLTGLYNKKTMEEMCIHYLEDNANNVCCSFFIVDLDNFKKINDTFGHGRGDEVLKVAAAVIKSCFRESDLIGRFGGDEFLALMIGYAPEELINVRARQIISALETDGKKKTGMELHCSVGVAMAGGGKETFSKLFSRADSALYQAKKNGRNTFFIAQ